MESRCQGERAPHSTLPEIERKKFLVPSTMQCYEYLGVKISATYKKYIKTYKTTLTLASWKLKPPMQRYGWRGLAMIYNYTILNHTLLHYSSIKIICFSLCLVLVQFNPIINQKRVTVPFFFYCEAPGNLLLWSQDIQHKLRSGTRSVMKAHVDVPTACQGDDGTYVESWWIMCRLQKCLLCTELCSQQGEFAELDLAMPW